MNKEFEKTQQIIFKVVEDLGKLTSISELTVDQNDRIDVLMDKLSINLDKMSDIITETEIKIQE